MIKAIFRFLRNNQNIRHAIFANNIKGKAIPMNEKKAVRVGDTYQAGKDKKRRNMDIIVTTITIAFIIFRIIVIATFSLVFVACIK